MSRAATSLLVAALLIVGGKAGLVHAVLVGF